MVGEERSSNMFDFYMVHFDDFLFSPKNPIKAFEVSRFSSVTILASEPQTDLRRKLEKNIEVKKSFEVLKCDLSNCQL